MNKLLLSLSSLIITSAAWSGTTTLFLQGLQKDLGFTRIERGVLLSQSIKVKPFGAMDRWTNPEAEATYNPTTNTIKLAEGNLQSAGSGYQLRDARVLRGAQFATTKLATIFHEMGHAELDVFVEAKKTPQDAALMQHFESVLRPFYKRNFSENGLTLFHEHFAYYRTDIIEFLYQEIDNILLANGYNKFKGACFMTKSLKDLVESGISREEFLRFYPLHPTHDPYVKRIGPSFIYVKGKEFDLTKASDAREVLTKSYQLFWAYHQTHYDFPADQNQFVARLNQGSSFQEGLANCRSKLWDTL